MPIPTQIQAFKPSSSAYWPYPATCPVSQPCLSTTQWRKRSNPDTPGVSVTAIPPTIAAANWR